MNVKKLFLSLILFNCFNATSLKAMVKHGTVLKNGKHTILLLGEAHATEKNCERVEKFFELFHPHLKKLLTHPNGFHLIAEIKENSIPKNDGILAPLNLYRHLLHNNRTYALVRSLLQA